MKKLYKAKGIDGLLFLQLDGKEKKSNKIFYLIMFIVLYAVILGIFIEVAK